MNIFCPVWGGKHLDLLKTALFKSFNWPKNKTATKDATWHFVTSNQEEANKAREIVNAKTSFDYIAPELAIEGSDKGFYILPQLLQVIVHCLNNNQPMLMATPDFIYGDGTIDAFKKIGSRPGTCVSIPHIRVHPEILEQLNEPPTNAKLISLALNFAHISWTGSEAGVENQRSYRSAIEWQKEGSSVSVEHLMPSPFFCNFLKEDLDYLQLPHDQRPPGFGAWDHKWPRFLIEYGRLRLIGSSDAALMVEVTDKDANVPPIDPTNKPGKFFNQDFHNNVQKQFISIFRGEA